MTRSIVTLFIEHDETDGAALLDMLHALMSGKIRAAAGFANEVSEDIRITLGVHAANVMRFVEDEAARLQACEAFINTVLLGLLCDDKEPVVLLPYPGEPDLRQVIKKSAAASVLKLRNSMRTH